MDEHVNAAVSQQKATASAPPPIQPPINPPPARPEDSGKSPHKSDKISKSDKIMLWATAVIAFGTVVSAAAIVMQYREMHAGAADTTAIAGAAGRNATAAEGFTTAAQGIETKIGLAEGDFSQNGQKFR